MQQECRNAISSSFPSINSTLQITIFDDGSFLFAPMPHIGPYYLHSPPHTFYGIINNSAFQGYHIHTPCQHSNTNQTLCSSRLHYNHEQVPKEQKWKVTAEIYQNTIIILTSQKDHPIPYLTTHLNYIVQSYKQPASSNLLRGFLTKSLLRVVLEDNSVFVGIVKGKGGLGVIFQDEVPIKWGQFHQYKLNGYGREEQHYHVLDGIFSKGNLVEGYSVVGNVVKFRQVSRGVQNQVQGSYLVQEFKKNKHLKGVQCLNKYCIRPKIKLLGHERLFKTETKYQMQREQNQIIQYGEYIKKIQEKHNSLKNSRNKQSVKNKHKFVDLINDYQNWVYQTNKYYQPKKVKETTIQKNKKIQVQKYQNTINLDLIYKMK